MRSAVCISGHFRCWEKYLDNYVENFLEPLLRISKVDVFVSTWDTLYPKNSFAVATNYWEKGLEIQKTDSDLIKAAISPKIIEIEEYELIKDKFLITNFTSKTNYHPYLYAEGIVSTVPMFYKIYKCNLLKKNFEEKGNFKYDLVFRYRIDSFWDKPFKLIEPQKDQIITPINNYGDDMVDDRFAYGSSESMDKYSNTYLNLEEIYKNDYDFGGEKTLSLNLKLNNIAISNTYYVNPNHRKYK